MTAREARQITECSRKDVDVTHILVLIQKEAKKGLSSINMDMWISSAWQNKLENMGYKIRCEGFENTIITTIEW